MGQNFAARTVIQPGGGIGFAKADAQGRLLVSSEAPQPGSVAAFSANEVNAVATASLPAVVGETNNLAGFFIVGTGATAAGMVIATITGLEGGTISIPVAVPAGVDASITPVLMNFTQPLPAAAADEAITISIPALGAGSLGSSVGIWGTVA